MPLQRDRQGNAWHWSQCVAWIGFDVASPKKGSIHTNGIKLNVTATEEHSLVKDAVAEFLGEVKERKLRPVQVPHLPLNEGSITFFMQRLERPEIFEEFLNVVALKARIGTAHARVPNSLFQLFQILDGLYFDRDTVLTLWPAPSELSLRDVDRVYLSEFVRFMIAISTELGINPDNRIPKSEVEQLIWERWPKDRFGELSKNRVVEMARFIRPIQDAKGGNFKSKRGT